jgi:putative transposase
MPRQARTVFAGVPHHIIQRGNRREDVFYIDEDRDTYLGWLQSVFKPLHMRYAQRFNRQRGCKGHVWQGRYFSSALDEHYLWSAIRYVERNPVRAKMVKKAENYAWSSAAAHCERYAGNVLTTKECWKKQF